MTISVGDCGEFTYTIMDLIIKLKELEKFILKIWVNGSELPFKCDNEWDIHFIQESVRVSRGNRIKYVALDSIVAIEIIKNKTLKEEIGEMT